MITSDPGIIRELLASCADTGQGSEYYGWTVRHWRWQGSGPVGRRTWTAEKDGTVLMETVLSGRSETDGWRPLDWAAWEAADRRENEAAGGEGLRPVLPEDTGHARSLRDRLGDAGPSDAGFLAMNRDELRAYMASAGARLRGVHA